MTFKFLHITLQEFRNCVINVQLCMNYIFVSVRTCLSIMGWCYSQRRYFALCITCISDDIYFCEWQSSSSATDLWSTRPPDDKMALKTKSNISSRPAYINIKCTYFVLHGRVPYGWTTFWPLYCQFGINPHIFYILRSKYYIFFLTPHVRDFPWAGAAEDQPFAPWTVPSSAHTLNFSYVTVWSMSQLWRAFGSNAHEGKTPYILRSKIKNTL
jgi:hypothetical protein